MTSLRRVLLVLSSVALCGALAAQEAGAVRERVLVRPGSRPMGTKIVQVAPAPESAPARLYEGTRAHRDWRRYASGGPAIARARYAAFASRFAPTPRYWHHGWSAGYPTTRIWRR